MKGKLFFLFVVITFSLGNQNCSKSNNNSNGTTPVIPVTPTSSQTNNVDFWLTSNDQSVLLQKQNGILSFATIVNNNPFIDVDSTQIFQTIDGFGFTLTGGSAYVINQLNNTDKTNLLQELFGTSTTSISISYLRISIGASDLNASVFSYDDMPSGQSDLALANFSLSNDMTDLIPLLKQIVAINPNIKIIATPWSPPLWMKDNNSSIGGSLLSNYYNQYAQYFVKYIQAMQLQGIKIDAITPQNEPLNPSNNPSMIMLASDENNFIKNSLGPAFLAASITTKIILYDHNCDQPTFPLTILADAASSAFVSGSAFHLYAGNINALSTVHSLYPNKQLYFTEQFTQSSGNFGADLMWHLKNVIIGSMRNWSCNALEWNLANDPTYGPHTVGGCTTCKGALTIGSGITRNVGYYIIAHASKFIPAGSIRIYSNISGSLNNVAFLTPAGKKILIVENDGLSASSFNIRFNGKWVSSALPGGAVATYIF